MNTNIRFSFNLEMSVPEQLERGEKKPRGVFERPKGSGTWWIRYWESGQERRKKIGTLAGAVAAYLAAKGGQGQLTPILPPHPGSPLFSKVLASYLASRPELESPTHAFYGKRFRREFAGLSLAEVIDRLQGWRAERLRKSAGPQSAIS